MQYKNLHTYTLEELFGSIKNRILIQNDEIRMVHLIDTTKVSRTLGIVRFIDVKDEIKDAHIKIVSGEMLGKTLFDANIDFDKEFLGASTVELPEWLIKDFNTIHKHSKAFYSRILVNSNESNRKYVYAELIEVIPFEIKDSFKNKVDTKLKVNTNIKTLMRAAELTLVGNE